VRLSVRDLAGNTSDAEDRPVVVDRTLGFVSTSRTLFFPQDGDGLSPSTALGFKLASPATVDWTIVNSAGAVVRTLRTAAPLAAGSYTYTWNGRNDAGAFVPRGTYRSRVVAVEPLSTRTQQVSFIADAFRVAVSDTTPARGQRITVTATTAESLKTVPRLTVFQPGIASYTVSMATVSSGVYRATLTLKSSSTGSMRFRVYATDRNGAYQRSDLYVPLH
jgi:hypothetical protein